MDQTLQQAKGDGTIAFMELSRSFLSDIHHEYVNGENFDEATIKKELAEVFEVSGLERRCVLPVDTMSIGSRL